MEFRNGPGETPLRTRKGTGEALIERYGEPMGPVQQGRIHFVLKMFLLVLTVLMLRLAQLHLNPNLELTQEEAAHIGQVELHEPRGEIYDRNGLILATSRDVPSIWVDPRKVTDVEALATALHETLGMERQEALERVQQADGRGTPRKFVWVKRWIEDVPLEALQMLVDASGGALSMEQEPVRFYPNGDTASHVLGFVNRDGKASEGLERQFDKHLMSVPGKHLARKDGKRTLLASLTLEYTEPTGGEDIITTIDTSIQHRLEDALDKRMEETNASQAMGLIMDPKTGAILALATRPAFDPNHYSTTSEELRSNRALLDVFEPGSAFKIVTASAGLEQGLITPETRINCENGGFNPYGHYIKDFHKLGVEPFSKCFEESSNVALIKVAAMIGPERLDNWIQRFGYGEQTSRDFQYESRGIYHNRERWSKLSMGSLPMGQEIAVTMPQLARSFAVIANGGFLVEPHIVEQAVNRRGEVTYQFEPREHPRVISEKTAQTMCELSHRVVLFGTGSYANIPEYRSGGKTGTAQMARPRSEGGGYYPDRYTTVFAGFAPVADPRLVCVIVIKEPMIKLHYGGYVCGPVFADVVRDALIRMNVPEDPVVDENAPEKMRKPVVVAEEEIVEDADTTVSREELAKLAAMEDSLDQLIAPLDSLELPGIQQDGMVTARGLPDFTGMTKRQVKERLAQLGIPWDPTGAGWVTHQEPPAGTPLNQVRLCALTFSNQRATEAEDETQRITETRRR